MSKVKVIKPTSDKPVNYKPIFVSVTRKGDMEKYLGQAKIIEESTDKLSPEYLEQFKQAQADNPNLHKYFGEGKEDED